MAKHDAWMPLYWGDYLRDTMHLRAEGHGAYLLLIAAYWTSGHPLPDDDDQLAAIARVDTQAWQKLKHVLGQFFDCVDGQWRHPRIDAEMAKAKRISKARQKAGKKGGKAKANAKQTPKQNPTPSPSPSQSPKSSDPSDQTPGRVASGFLDLKKEVWERGVAFLKTKNLSDQSARRVIGMWLKNHDPTAIVNAFVAAETQATPDPVPYITAVLENAKSPSKSQRPAPFDSVLAAASGILDRGPH